MEAAIKRTFARVVNDIRTLKHIESYVVAFAAIIFAILTTVGDSVSDDLKMAAILAGLGLLVFNLTVPQHKNSSTLDDYLNDRSSFVPLAERIKGARKLWIYGASSVNILSPENTLAMRKEILTHANGECRFIIQDPRETEALRILKKQVDVSVDYRVQDLDQAIPDATARLSKMKSWKCDGTVDYRFLDYSPGFSMVVIDPDKKGGVVIVEFYGFHHDHAGSRMNIEITKEQSERWFTYWVSQFDYMWQAAREPDADGE